MELRLNRKSKVLAAVLVVVAIGGRAVSLGAALHLSQQPRPKTGRAAPPPQRPVTLPHAVTFREVRGRGLLVETWVNSAGPFTFAVDTGAGITVISPRVASEASVAIQAGAGPSIAGLSGAVVSAKAANIETIALGDSQNYFRSERCARVLGIHDRYSAARVVFLRSASVSFEYAIAAA